MRFLPLICLCLLLSPAAVLAQDRFSSLEELMTGSEFDAAGLKKLGDEELESLNAWLREHMAQQEQLVRKVYVQDQPVEADAYLRGKEFTAIIPGHFEGWDGRTIFKLENGHVWKQISGGSYRVNMEDAVVVFYPAVFDSWRMRLEVAGPSIGVKRVK